MGMTLIQHVKLVSQSSSISFTSIPQNYDQLLIVASLRDTTGIGSFQLQKTVLAFNGDTANDSITDLTGRNIGVATGTATDRIAYHAAPPAPNNMFGSLELLIPRYTGSSYKSFVADAVLPSNDQTGDNSYKTAIAGKWSSTAAITSLEFTTPGAYVANSSITLYGITAGSDGSTTVS